jgi:taurine dioxygenase
MFDLSQYRRIAVEPLTGAIGAEISGVDLGALDDEIFAEIRRAFLDHAVIFFRDQRLDETSLIAFATRFAPPTLSPQAKNDGSVVHRLHRAADVPTSVRNLGDRWHADQSSRERPNMGAVLYCTEAPPYGGDTLFASLCAAYDHLAPTLHDVCDRLIAIHSLIGVYGPDGVGGTPNTRPFLYENDAVSYNETYAQLGAETLALIRKRVEHPLVCTHPETGRPILYVTGNHIIGLKGMADLGSQSLLDTLNQHVTRPEFTCRFRWKKESLAVWDNRCALHYAANDYQGFARTMLRVELEGNRPFGPAILAAPEAAQ